MSEQLNDDALYGEGGEAEREPVAQRVGNGPNTQPKPTKTGNLVALVKGHWHGRVIMVTAGSVLLVGALVVVGLTTRPAPAASLPPDIKGASVGAAPDLNDGQRTALAGSAQYRQMVDQVQHDQIERAKATGQSVQPMAVTLERDMKTFTTPEQAVAQAQVQAQSLGQGLQQGTQEQANIQQQSQYQQAQYQQQQPQQYQQSQQDPAEQARIQKAQQAVAELTKSPRGGTQTFTLMTAGNVGGQGQGTTSGPSQQAGAGVLPAQQGQPPAGQPSTASNGTSPQQVTLISAGHRESVRMDTAINTDLSGEFTATLITGRYAGATLTGSAQRRGTCAELQFRSMSLPGQGITVPLTASGFDAQTLEPCIATDVERKLGTKYVLKPLAAGIAAVGDAVRQSGTTVVINGTSTVTQSPSITGQRAGQIAAGAAATQVNSDANSLDTTPTVRVAPTTIVGIKFMADVIYTPRSQ
jgi:hypothetical protein